MKRAASHLAFLRGLTESAAFRQAIDCHRKQVEGGKKPVRAQAAGAPGNSGTTGSA